MRTVRGFFILLAVLATWGCAHSTPLDPILNDAVPVLRQTDENPHSLLGMYTFICNPDAQTIDTIPLRDAEVHLNVLKFLEPPILVYLTIEGAPHVNGNILDLNIGLRNPYVGLDQFTGFDVCGIVFSHGSATGFTDPDIIMPGDGDTRLLNPDGYTRWWNPLEFPHGNTALNYIDGILGTPAANADFNSTINGYKYFADGLEKNDPVTSLDVADRGMFGAGKQSIRHYTLDMSGGWVFNYAIDACWKSPSGSHPFDVPSDFPPGANRPEPYFIDVIEQNSLFYDPVSGCSGGVVNLQIDVYDHFDAASNQVLVESFDGSVAQWITSPVSGGEGYSTYEIEITNDELPTNMDVNLLISVVSDSSGYGGFLPGKPICSYRTCSVSYRTPEGWARTWGPTETFPNLRYDVTVDSLNDVIVTGGFTGIVDFDPGDGVTKRNSGSSADMFISRFNKDGEFLSVIKIGGDGHAEGKSIALDGQNNLFITGIMRDTVDFDPGPDVFELSCGNLLGVFLLKLTSDGSFCWARLWKGGALFQYRHTSVAVDDFGFSYLASSFISTTDLDPGPGVDEHTSAGVTDAFLCKLSPAGDYLGAKTWGGEERDAPMDICLTPDGDVVVTGGFEGLVDFDPGPGVNEWISNGDSDVFLSKFTSYGDLLWAVAWGSVGDPEHLECGYGVTSDQSGHIYVCGWFNGATDFDPGPGITMVEPADSVNSFLSKFNSDGTFNWVRTWDGDYWNVSRAVAVQEPGKIYVGGFFTGNQDLDPTDGIDEHPHGGGFTAYLCSLNSDGSFNYARSWGIGWNSQCYSVATAVDGSIYTTGKCSGSIDFDPGPGVCESGDGDRMFLYKLGFFGYW